MSKIHNKQILEAVQNIAPTIINIPIPAADDNYFKTSTVPTAGLNKTTTVTSFTKSYVIDMPVVPVIVVTDGADDNWTAVSIVVIGVDQFGKTISETVTATNSSGTWTGTALNAYLTLTSVAITITGTATGADAYIIGFAKTYGLGVKIAATGDVVIHNFNGATDAGTISQRYATYAVAGTPDAAKLLHLFIRSTHAGDRV